MKAVNPGIVYCAITRIRAGRSVQAARRARHELPRTQRAARNVRRRGRAAGPGSRPDRRHRRRRADGGDRDPRGAVKKKATGEGAEIDISMTDGAMSWLAMPAAAALAGDVRSAGDSISAGKWVCYIARTRRPTAGSAAARSSRSSGRRSLDGVGREDLIEKQFETRRKRRLGRDRRSLQDQDPRRVGSVQRRARLLHRAGSRTSTRRSNPISSRLAAWSRSRPAGNRPGRPARASVRDRRRAS